MGGLVVIADLAVMAIQQRTDGACTDPSELLLAVDQILNYVFFILAGVFVYRETRKVGLGALAGLLAGALDAVVVYAANTMIGCVAISVQSSAGGMTGQEMLLLSVIENVGLAAILGAAGAAMSSLARRRPER